MSSHQQDSIHVEGLGSFDWMVVDAGDIEFSCFYSANMTNQESPRESWKCHISSHFAGCGLAKPDGPIWLYQDTKKLNDDEIKENAS